ncbi:hypothetical protein ALC60_07141 [Trachymyrmex zeteki]|uniref:Mutator-like transposase domain-containing protein n=1 Tax=Mycetomoellerius zeteki TaxID=64791 RepID=A0A151X1F2_9HYME|nr:hypothetical protein ALC60_07141 [Trachymyrmex zeteki]
MSGKMRLENGRFVKLKVKEKRLKAAKAMSEARKTKFLTKVENVCKGKRIVDIEELGNNLVCSTCQEVLSLKNVMKNGAVHSGTGCDALNKVLVCLNIPTITKDVYKKYKQIVGKGIEEAAADSCKRAAHEERNLIQCSWVHIVMHLMNNIFIYSIYFYCMGWSKRGTGRSYDSLNGYATIIGFLSGRILNYTTRNRKCKSYELQIDKQNHDCRLNYHSSAKAMEADAGVQLMNNSSILAEAGLQVRVVIGDEDDALCQFQQFLAELNSSCLLVARNLQECFRTGGDTKVNALLTETKYNNKPRVIKNKKVINKIINHLKQVFS